MLSCSSTIFGNEPYTIIPIGDSITSGNHGNPGGFYRQVTQERLTEVGVSFDFVGDLASGNPNEFDTNHQGVSGIGIGGATDTLASPLQDYDPDFALVLLGTNNHFADPDTDFTSLYRELIEVINDSTTDVSIIFSTVPGFGDESFGSDFLEAVAFRNEIVFPAINGGLREAASEFDNVAVVDFFSAIDLETDLAFDGIHPNLFGQEILGNLFADELISQLPITSVPEPNSILVILGVCSAFTMKRKRACLI